MDRYRIRGGFTASSFSNGGTTSTGSPSASGTTLYGATTGVYETMSDQVTSDYYSRQREGLLTVRPMAKTYEARVPSQGSNQLRSTVDLSSAFGSGDLLRHFHGAITAVHPVWSGADERANVQAHAGVVPTQALSVVAAYELNKTIEMFKQAGNLARTAIPRILQLAADIQSGRVKKRMRNKDRLARDVNSMSQAVESYWLQAQYGWLPLYYDIRGHIRAFNREIERTEWKLSRGKSTDEKTTETLLTWGPWSSMGGTTTLRTRERSVSTVTCRSGIYYADEMETNKRLAADLGLDAASSLENVWEIIPWSFVIDWFIDVGSWLQAIKPKPGVRYLAAYRTILQTTLKTRNIAGFNFTGNMTGSWTSSEQSVLRVDKTRYCDVPIPSFPTQGTGVSSIIRGISAAALSMQQLRKLLK